MGPPTRRPGGGISPPVSVRPDVLSPRPMPRSESPVSLAARGKRSIAAEKVWAAAEGTYGSGPFGSGPFGGSPARPINAQVDVSMGEFTSNATATVHKPKRVVVIRDKRQVLLQSSILIKALQEAYDYKDTPGKNSPTPELVAELGLSDPIARSELAELIAELRKLNAFLEANKKKPQITAKPIVDVRKQTDKFLTKYGGTVAKGAGFLTVGLVAELAISLGASPEMIYTSLAGFFLKAR